MARIWERITKLEMQQAAIITPSENETPMQHYLRLINEPIPKHHHTSSYTPEETYRMMIGA